MIRDGQCMTTVLLLAATHMHAVGGFLARTVSRSLCESFHHSWSGWLSLSGTSSENLKVVCTIPAATFSLRVGVSFVVNVSSHRM